MTKETNFESILALVGDYGKFQKQLLLFILIPASFFIAVTVNLVYFQVIVPDYWCHVPIMEDAELSPEEWKNLAIPRKEDGSYEKCLQYKSDSYNEGLYVSYYSLINGTQECVHGWDHDRSIFWETLATDEEWLCDKEIYSTHILAFSMAGNTLGTIILPIIADRITGRKVIFFITLVIHLIFNLVILFVRQFYLTAIFRLLAGLVYPTNFQMAYVVILEFLSPECRSLASVICFVAWTFGMCFASLVAFLLPHWWYLVIVTIIPPIAFLGLWRAFPESPRWMLSQGKIKECSKALFQVAQMNGKSEVTEQILEEKLKIEWEIEKSSRLQFSEILQFPRFCKNMTLISLMALCAWTTYGCVLLNMEILPNHYFLSFFILSSIQLPSNIIGMLWVDYLGRRMSSLLTFALGAVFCLLALLTLKNRLLLLCMVTFVKSFATVAQCVIYVMAVEIFPTPIRSTGLGLVGVALAVGMTLSPYIIEAEEVFQYTIMIFLHLACILLGLFMPETIGLPLPQTLRDAEILGKDRSFFKWIHHWNVEKRTPCDAEKTKL